MFLLFVLFSQEELSARICGLLKAFSDGATALRFAAAFFATQANEWNRLDQWRMDKYMMVTMSMATSIGNTRIYIYFPVTLKCTQDFVLVAFHSYITLRDRQMSQNITVSHVTVIDE